MEEFEDFNEFQKRLNVLEEEIRGRALEIAAEIFARGKISRHEALEKGISKAEMEKRNL
jgi:uncharacterized membrane protein